VPPQPQQQSTNSDRIDRIVVNTSLAVLAFFFFFADWLPYLIPLFLIVGGEAAWWWWSRFYRRTKGGSLIAYHSAQASTTDPIPKPPDNFNWVEHEIYRASLKTPAVQPQKLWDLDTRSRLEHELIVAGTGHGKTQLIEWQILKDLDQPDPPPLIVIDSKSPDPDFRKSNMIERISRLDIFHPDHGRLRDRLIIVDPRDHPALNMFDVPHADEEATNEIISQLAYFLGALLEAGTSATQAALYQPLARLMLNLEGANLDTLSDAVTNIADYADQMEGIDPRLKNFLLGELGTTFGKGTKDAVKRRIFSMTMQSPTFDKMFNAKTNQLDLVDALNTRKIVLVSTDTRFLKDLSPVFGKYIISRVISAALASRRIPAYVYVDEAKPYTDEKTEELLTTLRSYRLGAILAYQTFPNLAPSLRVTLATNTTIKFIGGGDDDAAKIFASHLRAPPEFIYNQLVDSNDPPHFTRFALHVKNKTATAQPYQIPIGSLDKLPRMDNDAYRRLRAANRARLQDKKPPDNVTPFRRDTNVSEDEE
jgi:hypothetical protein